jgi:hypothetical protein
VVLMMKYFACIEREPKEGLLSKLRGTRNLFQEKCHDPMKKFSLPPFCAEEVTPLVQALVPGTARRPLEGGAESNSCIVSR